MTFDEWKALQEEFGVKTMDIPFQDMSIQDGRELLQGFIQLSKVTKTGDGKMEVKKPPKNSSALEKLKFYDQLIADGLNDEEIKVVRRRINNINTDFDTQASALKNELLVCINDFLHG